MEYSLDDTILNSLAVIIGDPSRVSCSSCSNAGMRGILESNANTRIIFVGLRYPSIRDTVTLGGLVLGNTVLADHYCATIDHYIKVTWSRVDETTRRNNSREAA
jgi:hypothetical protein